MAKQLLYECDGCGTKITANPGEPPPPEWRGVILTARPMEINKPPLTGSGNIAASSRAGIDLHVYLCENCREPRSLVVAGFIHPLLNRDASKDDKLVGVELPPKASRCDRG